MYTCRFLVILTNATPANSSPFVFSHQLFAKAFSYSFYPKCCVPIPHLPILNFPHVLDEFSFLY